MRIGETTQSQVELRETTLTIVLTAGRRNRLLGIVDHHNRHAATASAAAAASAEIQGVLLIAVLLASNRCQNAMLQNGRNWRQNAIGYGIGINATGRTVKEILIGSMAVIGQQCCTVFAATVTVRHFCKALCRSFGCD